jgi:alkylation response protein AidB-like acyl-CoA dehydrogenase
MDLSLNEEQEAVRELLQHMLGREVTSEVVRNAEPLGHSLALWQKLVDSGVPGLGAPASCGGGDVDLATLAVAAEQVGMVIAPAPVIEHSVALRAIAAADPNFKQLGALVEGSAIAAFAPRRARNGIVGLVPGGAIADVVVALDGAELVAMSSPPGGVAPDNHGCAPIADRDLRAGDRVVLAEGAAAQVAFGHALDEWRVLTAAALVGIAQASLDLAVAYVKERQQFGVPIGSFQAVQHGLADLPGEIDGARLLFHEAAWALANNEVAPTGSSGAELAIMAFLFAGEVARFSTDRCVQYHGGYGVSEEYDAQMYYRRARAWPLVAGDPAKEMRLLGDLVLDGRA